MNKNFIIGILAGLLIMSSLWGQIETRSNKDLKKEKVVLQKQLSQVEASTVSSGEELRKTTAELNKFQVEFNKSNTLHEKLKKDLTEKDAALAALQAENQQLIEKQKKLVQNNSKQEVALTEKNTALAKKDTVLTTLQEARKQLVQDNKKHESALVEAVGKIKALHKQLKEQQVCAIGKEEALHKQLKKQQAVSADKEDVLQKQLKKQLEEQQAVAAKKVNALQKQLKEQQANAAGNVEVLQKQMKEQQVVAAGKVDASQKQLKEQQHKFATQAQAAEQKKVEDSKKMLEKLREAEGVIRQLQQERAAAANETESLRAQVIGFEKVVEERNTKIFEFNNDLNDCKVNTKVLISKIADQENAEHGLQEKMRFMVKNLVQQQNDAAEENQAAQNQAEQQ